MARPATPAVTSDEKPPAIPPDTKDWSFVLHSRCPQCGYIASDLAAGNVAQRVRAAAPQYAAVLASPAATHRPRPTKWSPLEYACHVRTVQRLYADRVARMLVEDNPLFQAVDHDQIAVTERFDLQDPTRVSEEVAQSADQLASALERVTGDQRHRGCRKSDGHGFTLDTLARYVLHDIEHHLWDITGQPSATWY